MKQLLERNTVVHLLVPNRRDGDSNIPVDLYGHGFFLQAATFELLAELGSELTQPPVVVLDRDVLDPPAAAW